MPALSVYIPDALDEEYYRLLRNQVDPAIQIHNGDVPPDDVDVLVEGKPDPEWLRKYSSLQALIIPYAGVPDSTQALMRAHLKIRVYNLHHNAQAVAEHTLAMLLALQKNLIPMHNALAQGDWTPRYQSGAHGMLHGSTILMLGFGAIGQAIARLLKPFDISIFAVRKNHRNETNPDRDNTKFFTIDSLHDLLPNADFLIITLPLTPSTQHLISTRELALLPSHARIINVGRGAVIEQRSLYSALRSKKIAGAALDVWYNYPEDILSRKNTHPADLPFHELDNVLLSPHKAGGLAMKEVEELRMQHLADVLNRILQRDETLIPVNIEAGY